MLFSKDGWITGQATLIPWMYRSFSTSTYEKGDANIILYYLQPVILISSYKTDLNSRLVLPESDGQSEGYTTVNHILL